MFSAVYMSQEEQKTKKVIAELETERCENIESNNTGTSHKY